MQIYEFSLITTIFINAFAWLIIHLTVAYLGTKLPAKFFPDAFWFFQSSKWENQGNFYYRYFYIKVWKNLLPDGATWFAGGFAKKNLEQKNAAYFQAFINETCRGETVHWIVILASPLFFLFNPPWAGLVNIAYAILANMPCIILQRANRPRLRNALRKYLK